MKRVDEEEIQAKRKETEDKQQKLLQASKIESSNLKKNIDTLQDKISELTQSLNSNNREKQEISRTVDKLEGDLREFRDKLTNINVGTSNVDIFAGAEVDNLKIGSQVSAVNIFGSDRDSLEGKPTRVRQIEIYEPWLVYEQQAQTRTVKLKSSLPENIALQPGSTAVYTVVLNVKRSLIFTPAKYRLQFYVNYSFSIKQTQQAGSQLSNEEIFTNTIAHSLSIRPSVYSVITGAIFGGIAGSIARLLQSQEPFMLQSMIASLVLSVILGVMAVIFMARKSDAQSFVSVEDFWGGILIGFLVGYTGTSFFESLIGKTISPGKIISKP